MSDNLFYIVVEGYFGGVSKSVSKWFVKLCENFVQFWDGEVSRMEVVKW